MSNITLRKEKKPTAFSAKAAGDTLCIDMFDAVGEDWAGDGITASTVAAAIKEAGAFKNITLNLNSPGGDLFEGCAIYNLLKATGKPVCVNVVGLAASAASLIACAGDTVNMQLGSMYMVHEGMALVAGFAKDMRAMADTLDKVSASAADIYVAKSKLPKEKVLALMEAETWMNPEEAVANGFATAVSKEKAAITNSFDLSMFKHAPKMEAKTKEVDGEHLTAGDFIYVGDPDKVDTWALPWHFSTEEKTKSHLRDALARWDQEEKIPEAHKAEARAKLVRLCKEHGIEVSNPKGAADFNLIDILRKVVEVEKRK